MARSRQEWLEVAERHGAETHQALLKAAVNLVAEFGYSRFSTQLLAERAGVTRGAVQHHFGNRKLDLVVALAEYVYQRFRENAAGTVQAGADLVTRVEKTIDSAFEIYRGPEAVVLLELWMAARSDDALKAALGPVMARLDDSIGSGFAIRLEVSQATADRIEAIRYLARFVFRGMTLERQLWIDRDLELRVVALLKEVLVLALNGQARAP